MSTVASHTTDLWRARAAGGEAESTLHPNLGTRPQAATGHQQKGSSNGALRALASLGNRLARVKQEGEH